MIDQTWYEKPMGIKQREAAGGVVYRIDRGEAFVALVTEGKIKKWILPKGGIDKGETILQAAVREIGEEAGIHTLTHVGDLGFRERLNYDKTKWVKTHYFIFKTMEATANPTDTSREYDTEWFSIQSLPQMFWPEQKDILDLAIQQIISLHDL